MSKIIIRRLRYLLGISLNQPCQRNLSKMENGPQNLKPKH